MCGRFSMFLPTKSIAEFFLTLNLQDVAPRYNIAPATGILACLQAPNQPTKRVAMPLFWGLIPTWARDKSIGMKLINARSETLAEKPSFRAAFRSRRCLIPASGFFEWQAKGKRKQACYITSAREQPLAFAGLWEHWSGPEGEEISSCTIITCVSNEVMAPIHDRMPVLLDSADFELWLDPQVQDTRRVAPLLRPCPVSWLRSWSVSDYVGNFRNQGPRCIEPFEAEPPEALQMSLF